ncbi:MAG: extracellular solute-binding protein [Firmicutes bacterium]|nr:extracellular solute-binding protein [Bacillota bacterium]
MRVKSSWSCGSYYAISANTKYPEEAWTFIKWLSGPEGAKAYAAACLKARTREWQRQQLPGSPVYVPDLFNSKLAMKALEDEYLPQLPPKVQAEY